jgi:hypothetical protein
MSNLTHHRVLAGWSLSYWLVSLDTLQSRQSRTVYSKNLEHANLVAGQVTEMVTKTVVSATVIYYGTE